MTTLDLDVLPRGRRLRVLRTAADLTLWQVALKTGMREPRLSELEKGRRLGSPEEWARLAAVFEGAGLESPA